ncbi:MAG: YdeI/OmpD-associated family protein, partial [Planctomycetota bacterium]
AAALAADGQFRSAWDELPPGRRRGLCYRVDTAKRPETRARRVAEVREEVLVGPAEPPPARRRTGRRPGRDR